MDIITLTHQNIEKEHLCCTLSSKATEIGVAAKKEWLKCRIEEGLTFKKLDVRGKVFIEYLPAENAWVPIEARGYMFINCFWVAGSFKGNGYGKQLLTECEEDAKKLGYKGVTITVGSKKRPFLSDKTFMIRQGYEVCDSCPPYFELLVKHFKKDTSPPTFKECAKLGMGKGIHGIDIFYTAQCPYTVPYAKMLEPIILESDYPVRTYQIKTKEMAQEHVAPVTTYSVFIDGEFYTQEVLTPERLSKLIKKIKG